MNCTNCGTEYSQGMKFCATCGARLESPPVAAHPPAHQTAARPAPAPSTYKGLGARLAASILDTILYFVFAWVVAAQMGSTSSSGFDLEGAPAFLTFAIWATYYVLFEAFLGGTLGKLILGMRVVNRRGQAPGLGSSLLRNLLRIVDFLPLFYLLGGIMVASSKEKQRLGDRVAGTFVVSR